MNDNLIHSKDIPADEPIVIADECGDSMWDAVLGQQVNICDLKRNSIKGSLSTRLVTAVQKFDLPAGSQTQE